MTDTCYVDAPNNRWYSARTGELFPIDPPEPPALALGPVMYSVAEMDAWPGSGSAYTGMAGTTYGNVNYLTPTDWGTGGPTTNANNDVVIQQSVFALVQAMLWRADGTTARRNKVIAFLDGIKDITVISGTNAQERLDWGWVTQNAVRAAWIIDYPSEAGHTQFRAMLRNIVLPKMDWYTAPNWFAVFAASRLMIASYREVEAEWTNAVAYFEWHLPRSIYHATYDGTEIVPIRAGTRDGVNWLWDSSPNPKTSAPISNNATRDNWNEIIENTPPFTASYVGTGFPGGQFVNGTDGEAARDLGHEQFTIAGFVHCALVMERVGYAISAESLERIRAMAQWHAGRVYSYLSTGTLDPPAGDDPVAVAGQTHTWGWRSIARLFESAVPSNVTLVMGESEITGSSYVGYQHIVGDRYGDGTLL